MHYSIIKRPKRRTIAIQIKPDLTISVLVPRWASQKTIDAFISAKQTWIQNTVAKLEKNKPKKQSYKPGALFLYLGDQYPLVIETGETNSIKIWNKQLVLKTPDPSTDDIKTQLLNWYIQRATDIIVDRVACHQKQMGVIPNKIRIKSQSTKWGSCSMLGNLNFNWKLIKMPLKVLD